MTNTGKIPSSIGVSATQGVIDRTKLHLSRQLKFPEHLHEDHNREVRAMITRLAIVPVLNS